MPIYEYEVASDSGCKACGGRFELRRSLGRQELNACPVCKKPVSRVISLPNSPRISKPLSVSGAKNAGFTVFEKVEQGVYERQ